MTQEEIIKMFNTTESIIRTNFPKFCAKQLTKGYLITRKGHYPNAEYFVEQVEPEIRDKSEFSETKKRTIEELPNEHWIACAASANYEVSDLGRFRNASTKVIYEGTIKENYCCVYIHSQPYLLHRLIMLSFQPIENAKDFTVDHINGIRTDNRLENLRWVSQEDNTMLMLKNRAEMNKELTRIIQKLGYDKTLELLKNI